jgi:hypothetical protein
LTEHLTRTKPTSAGSSSRRLQALRAGQYVTPPAVAELGVTVTKAGE